MIVFCHTVQVQFQPNCEFPKSIAALLTFNAALFTYMFSSFYIKSYTKKKSPTAAAVVEKKINYDENCNVTAEDLKSSEQQIKKTE